VNNPPEPVFPRRSCNSSLPCTLPSPLPFPSPPQDYLFWISRFPCNGAPFFLYVACCFFFEHVRSMAVSSCPYALPTPPPLIPLCCPTIVAVSLFFPQFCVTRVLKLCIRKNFGALRTCFFLAILPFCSLFLFFFFVFFVWCGLFFSFFFVFPFVWFFFGCFFFFFCLFFCFHHEIFSELCAYMAFSCPLLHQTILTLTPVREACTFFLQYPVFLGSFIPLPPPQLAFLFLK